MEQTAPQFNPELYKRACERLRHSPADLTADDLSQFRCIDDSLVVYARDQRNRESVSESSRRSKLAGEWKFAEQVAHQILKVVGIGFKESRAYIRSLESQMQVLQTRLLELEKRPIPKYCGTWQPGYRHSVGDLVTRSGGLWFCAQETSTQPGTDGAWQLIVKKGGA